MLFNSYLFLLLFLPVVVLGYYWLARDHFRLALVWLGVASLGFYAWWNPEANQSWTPFYLAMLVGSAAGNFVCARLISAGRGRGIGRFWLVAGVSGNLGLIAYFKYRGLFMEIARWATGSGAVEAVALPLAISFYTFIQIAYLVDAWRGEVPRYSFGKYLLFVVFFPHLIAGPIVHHCELVPQFRKRSARRVWRNLSIGLTLLAIGLFKKVVIADALARIATPLFDLAASGTRPLTMLEGWIAALGYSTQLYFDFSGYSDMAIGLSFCFGIRLPLNFNSPYQAVSVVDFWRRWHMTLSRFLRDYLYIPMGGGRCRPVRRYTNLMVTMVLGGLWHGAGISYLLWGFLHGLFLCVNHGWFALREKLGLPKMPKPLAIGLTFLVVVFAWVPFRAGSYELTGGNFGTSLKVTAAVYESMCGVHGAGGLPPEGIAVIKESRAIRPLVLALLIAWFLPNSQRWMGRFRAYLGKPQEPLGRGLRWLAWKPTPLWLAGTLALLYAVGSELDKLSEFIYYQF